MQTYTKKSVYISKQAKLFASFTSYTRNDKVVQMVLKLLRRIKILIPHPIPNILVHARKAFFLYHMHMKYNHKKTPKFH